MRSKSGKANIMAATLAVSALCVAGSVQAQGEAQQAPAGYAELQELQERAQELETRLNLIARQAEQEHPGLRQQQDNLETLYHQKLEQFGYPDQEKIAELQAMQQRLQAPDDLEAAERELLMQEFQAEVTKMQQAQTRAQEDPDIQNAIQALQDTRLDAMSEIDAEAPALQQRLEAKIGQLQQLQHQIMQQQRQPAQ